jgi:predicted ArsR family transcriptional regulator
MYHRSPELPLKGSKGVVEKGVEKGVERVVEKLTTNQQRIIEFVRESVTISARELAEKVGISPRKVQENLAKLRLKGFLKKKGRSGQGRSVGDFEVVRLLSWNR